MYWKLGLCLSLSTALLTGCGSGEQAISGARSEPNDFAGVKNPVDDFSNSSTGDSTNNSDLASNEVRITMEVPGSVAPDGELTRRQLRIVQPDTVSVYVTNTALQKVNSVKTTTRLDPAGYTIIAFEDGQPLAPNVVIDATYGNARMRALAADSDRDIKVNPFSEYLVRYGLANYTPGELGSILDCVNDASGQLCLNKYVWSTLADQIQDFEIDIPETATVQSALDLLHQRGDFAHYVSAMADYALLDEASSGKISASSADYNSVFLGVGLGQSFAEPSISGAGQWTIQTAQEERLEDAAGVGYVYPALTLTSFDAFNIRVTSLATDIPYDRELMLHADGSQFFLRGSEYWERNTHSSSPGAATLKDDTRLLAGRSLYQSITGRGSSRITGWTRNPYYLDAFTSTPVDSTVGPDRVLAGYFDAGKTIELEVNGDQLRRKQTLEKNYQSIFELHLLRPAGNDTFDPSVIQNKDYNALYLSTRFNDPTSTSTPLAFESGLGTWSIDGSGNITQALQLSTVRQDDSGTVTRDPTGTLTTPWLVSSRTSRLSTGDKDIGRLNLDVNTRSGNFDQPEAGLGASTPDGSLLAFNLDDSPVGDGLLIAAPQPSTGAPTSGRYRLQGVALGLSSSANHLRHFDNAVLTIQSNTVASLQGDVLSVVNTISGNQVAPPTSSSIDQTLAYSQSGVINGQVSFTSGNFTLDGFYSDDHSQLFLRLRDTNSGEQAVGLVMATRLP